MGWGDGAWGDDRWGGETVVHPLSASGSGQGSRGAGAGARLSVVSALGATGNARAAGTAALASTHGLRASGVGRGAGAAAFSDLWQLGGLTFEPSSDLEFDAESISVSLLADAEQVETLRGFGPAGDIATKRGFAGYFSTVSRAGGGSMPLQPGLAATPALAPTDVYLASLSETDLGAESPREVEIELQRETNRRGEYSPVSQSGPIELEFESGTIGLSERDVGLIDREGSAVGSRPTLELLLSARQVGAIADNVGYPAGVVGRTIPDGSDKAVDETPDNRQTVTLSTNQGLLDVADGAYLVEAWSVELYSQTQGHRWLATLEIVSADN